MMAMWPINNFFQFLSSTHKSNEDRVNLYKKEDENPEADQQDLEERQHILKEQ